MKHFSEIGVLLRILRRLEEVETYLGEAFSVVQEDGLAPRPFRFMALGWLTIGNG